MLTPFFKCSQDEEYVYIDVKISNIRFSAPALEMVIEENLFIFALPPYYLRLRFPHKLIDDEERSRAEFKSSESIIAIRVPKLNKGEDFPDLDLSAKLLARANDNQLEVEDSPVLNSLLINESIKKDLGSNTAMQSEKRPLIQEIDIPQFNEKQVESVTEQMHTIENEASTFNWEIEQKLPDEVPNLTELSNVAKYGFNNQYSNMIDISLANGNDINELSKPDVMNPDDRIIERVIKENLKFDPEFYANDYLTIKYKNDESIDDDKMYSSIMSWKPIWKRKYNAWSKTQQENKAKIETLKNSQDSVMASENTTLPKLDMHVNVDFTSEEEKLMLDLPKKSYILDDPRPTYYTIVSLLFAYSFDLRENEGDHTVESAWSIGKLAPQISCLDSQLIQTNNSTETNMIKVVVLTSSRRSLCYPLHRHFDLIKQVWDDVYYILRCGKRAVLKCLLNLREQFRFHDVYYVYCLILLDDLCSWVLQDSCSELVLRNLAHQVRKESSVMTRKDIIFEKIMGAPEDDVMKDSEDSMDGQREEELEVINLEDIEELAECAYAEQRTI
ncbi:unnamed protein product [[Candida] boidinii]|uniref:Unnamed protein product n=1 Tax=Candida boidinii TaxID=5477 RepID=A0A9W6STQ9_CANBO|nr:hypothetical protein BVG19_g2372 [[Candida] boidinii]OWB51384.1 hypothetical protein B5S27_g2944 [[Candida] boidinii]OWB65826.1 hypothetical protein B5S30_g1158 [[Candida] boidinii]GME66593.1 unnamed protein product [[Candida] boidinii]